MIIERTVTVVEHSNIGHNKEPYQTTCHFDLLNPTICENASSL
jgi:hypothetical protein